MGGFFWKDLVVSNATGQLLANNWLVEITQPTKCTTVTGLMKLLGERACGVFDSFVKTKLFCFFILVEET